MKAKCKKCGEYFTLNSEEEDCLEAGNLHNPICDDCYYDDEDSAFGGMPEIDTFSDADSGL